MKSYNNHLLAISWEIPPAIIDWNYLENYFSTIQLKSLRGQWVDGCIDLSCFYVIAPTVNFVPSLNHQHREGGTKSCSTDTVGRQNHCHKYLHCLRATGEVHSCSQTALLCLVDLEKAFDRVPSKVLRWALRNLSVDNGAVHVIQGM